MIVVITITYNRLELTKQYLSELKNKAGKQFYHIIVDNGSKDNTIKWLKEVYFKDQEGTIYSLDKNVGVLRAWLIGINKAFEKFGDNIKYFVKFDNDCEILTDNILSGLLEWYERGCNNYIIAPLDTEIKEGYFPRVFHDGKEREFKVLYTSHTGGIFQIMPVDCAKILTECKDLDLINGDLKRGIYWAQNGKSTIYLTEFKIAHRGNEHQSKNYVL